LKNNSINQEYKKGAHLIIERCPFQYLRKIAKSFTPLENLAMYGGDDIKKAPIPKKKAGLKPCPF
jgi:hypothetical protein